MQSDAIHGDPSDSEWAAFITKLEAAELEFAQGRPAAFKDLWSHSDDVSICGALGAWSRDGTKWHLGSTGLAHSFPKVHAAERKLGLRSGPTSLISSRPSTFDFVFLAGRRSRLSTCG